MTAPCPQCGGYKLAPHCADPACPESWCVRAECRWESDTKHTAPVAAVVEGVLTEDIEPITMPNGMKHVVPKRWLRPITYAGNGIVEDTRPGEVIHLLPFGGWVQSQSPVTREGWSQDDRSAMWRTIDAMMAAGIAFVGGASDE